MTAQFQQQLRGTVVERRSLASFPCPALDLLLTVTTYVGKPSAIGQPTQPIIFSG